MKTLILAHNNKKATVFDELFNGVKVVNLPVPNGVEFFINKQGIRVNSDSVFYTKHEWTKILKQRGNKPAICLCTEDANLNVLLHELGHYLHYKGNREEFNSGSLKVIEERANEYGAEYYFKVTGKTVKLYNDKKGWGKPNWKLT